jgi:hypothetical protein
VHLRIKQIGFRGGFKHNHMALFVMPATFSSIWDYIFEV